MKLFINGTGCISPQTTFNSADFLSDIREYQSNRLLCVDPDYSTFFDAGGIRRMGRLMKFGTAAGLIALKDAGIKTPNAISTGTALGLPEISQKFLRSIIESEETIVSPTAFIQSTHNTVSSNIALLCACHGHNNTFSHKAFSFESALTDALLLAEEKMNNILVGSYDEVSDYKYAALKAVNKLRTDPVSNLQLLSTPGKGFIAGEGAAFFVLSTEKTSNTYASFNDVYMFYKPENSDAIKNEIDLFLIRNNISLSQIDIVISGLSGNTETDKPVIAVNNELFNSQTILSFKNLCGEYMTATSFAMWLASQILKTGKIPEAAVLQNKSSSPRNILIHNFYGNNHSLLLLSNV